MNSDKIIESIAHKIKLLTGGHRKPPVILCIGSDRVTGDCLGPLVGHLLRSTFNVPAFVYGSLLSPVTALNLIQTERFIRTRHDGSVVIAVDSSLGNETDVGSVHVIDGGIYPGAAVGKTLPKVGDVAVTATVAASGRDKLYSVRLGLVYDLAFTVASAISKSLAQIAA